MTNQYMTKLYHDLLSNSPQTVTIDIPADMGTGQISQVVTKQGAVVSDWKMNYFSDMNVQGVSCEDYIQLLFCFNAASSDAFRQGLRIENQHAYFKIQKTSMDCGHENMLKFQLESSARLPFEQNYYIAAENRIGNSTEKNGEKDKTMICWFVQREKMEEIEKKGFPDYLWIDEGKILFLNE